jgi:hypothetical protein
MPRIIRNLPFSDRPSSLPVPGGRVVLLPFQIALTVSLTDQAEHTLHPRAPRFPAVLDTGFNKTFLIQEEHLNQWAGLRREHFVQAEEMTVHGRKVPVFAADIWSQPNVPGKREDAPGRPPFRIRLYPGIAVSPRGTGEPRLPLLGRRALAAGDLQMSFRWRAMLFSLRTTPWWQRLFG